MYLKWYIERGICVLTYSYEYTHTHIYIYICISLVSWLVHSMHVAIRYQCKWLGASLAVDHFHHIRKKTIGIWDKVGNFAPAWTLSANHLWDSLRAFSPCWKSTIIQNFWVILPVSCIETGLMYCYFLCCYFFCQQLMDDLLQTQSMRPRW